MIELRNIAAQLGRLLLLLLLRLLLRLLLLERQVSR